MAKSTPADRARTRPLSLEFLRELGALDGFTPPAEPFDPSGAWTNAYHLWLVQQRSGGGSLRLERQPAGRDAVRLTVALAVAESAGYLRRTKAVLDCASDPLCTPKSWTLQSQALDVDDKPIPGTQLVESGALTDGRLTLRFGDQRRTEPVAQPATSHWSLFDAVQRLPGPATQPLRFTLLEEMDLVKPDQRLEFREARELKLGDATLRLRGYQQTGRGVLPWQYWVDERGRLLFAFSGVRAYLYDPNAEAWMQRKLDPARARTRRMRQPK